MTRLSGSNMFARILKKVTFFNRKPQEFGNLPTIINLRTLLSQRRKTCTYSSFASRRFHHISKINENELSITSCSKPHLFTCSHIHSTASCAGRYGHRLVKLWEKSEYTTEPQQVYRTGGRLPVKNWKGEIVPGRVWTAKLGGGLPRQWYWVDTKRLTADEVENGVAFQEKVVKIVEDDNRSGYVALVAGPLQRRWILSTQNMKVGDLLTNSAKAAVGGLVLKDGDAYPLFLIPIGTKVCSIEFRPGKGGQIARSAGTFCIVVRKTEDRAILQMPSKRQINVNSKCVAVIGEVSNQNHENVHWGSPQKRREYGLRPTTGRKHRNDGRFVNRNLPVKPPVIIPDVQVLQRGSEFDD